SRVNEEKCIGCGACYIACRDGANQAMEFDLQRRKARTNEDRCVGCLLCQHVCPVWDCISYKHRRKYVTGGMHEDALRFIER
ncbi:MAG: 4Fe-4S binding protein, partial [Candidatus Sumerlaeia bacterium]|nr:4Fe-4S binding protein [Candidatus Sumerlaeia bacterium]